jgi:hypothetical protein
MTISRMLAAMLATAALIAPIAPTATARPLDPPIDMHQSTAEALAQQRKQDLRMPDRRDPTPSVAPGQPTWPAHPSPIPAPAPIEPAQPVADDGIEWATIGIGVGLSILAFAAIAGVSRRSGGSRRERVSA